MFDILIETSKYLQNSLSELGIITRRNAGPGIWMSCLLPTAFIVNDLKDSSTSLQFKVAACISYGLLVHSLLIFFVLKKKTIGNTTRTLISSTLSSLLLYYKTQEGCLFSIGYGFLSIFSYDKILLPLMKLFPRSFTYGEATVVTQSFILFLISFLIRSRNEPQDCMGKGTSVLQVGIICVMTIGIISYVQKLKNKPLKFFSLLLFVILFVLFPTLYIMLKEDPLKWIIFLITEDTISVHLFGYWFLCSIIGVVAVMIQSRNNQKASTIVRKVFHILAVLVFIPGIFCKPCLMYVASGVAFAIFVGLDMVRILNLHPVGSALQASFDVFADEKDEGPISLTPLYLLAGCALPLWIHSNPLKAELLPLLSGILAIGIGDTFASVCGSLVGKNKWRGSLKTKEGTAACFLSQFFCIIVLIHFGYVPRTNLIKPTLATAATSLAEAKIDQIDNLALPLIMYILLL